MTEVEAQSETSIAEKSITETAIQTTGEGAGLEAEVDVLDAAKNQQALADADRVARGDLLVRAKFESNSVSTGPVVKFYRQELIDALTTLSTDENIDQEKQAEFEELVKALKEEGNTGFTSTMENAIIAVQGAAGIDTNGALVVGSSETHLQTDGIIGSRTERVLALINGRDTISLGEFKEVTGGRWNWTDYLSEADINYNYGSMVGRDSRHSYGITQMFYGKPRESLIGYMLSAAEGTTDLNGNLKYANHVDPGNGAVNWGMYSVNSAYHSVNSDTEADAYYHEKLRTEAIRVSSKMEEAGLDPSDPLVMGAYLSLYLQSPRQAQEGLQPLFRRIAAEGATPESLLQAMKDAGQSAIDAGDWWTDRAGHDADQTRRFNAMLTRLGYFESGQANLAIEPSDIEETQQLMEQQRAAETGWAGHEIVAEAASFARGLTLRGYTYGTGANKKDCVTFTAAFLEQGMGIELSPQEEKVLSIPITSNAEYKAAVARNDQITWGAPKVLVDKGVASFVDLEDAEGGEIIQYHWITSSGRQRGHVGVVESVVRDETTGEITGINLISANSPSRGIGSTFVPISEISQYKAARMN